MRPELDPMSMTANGRSPSLAVFDIEVALTQGWSHTPTLDLA